MTRHYKKYTDQDIVTKSSEVKSLASLIKALGLAPAGSTYVHIRNKVQSLSIDTSHWTGQGWSKDKVLGPKRPIEDYLSNKIAITSHNLRLRLLSEGIFSHKCTFCHLTEWLEVPIPLELDHINGNHKDNSLHNLRLLCPNCHTLTPTYKSKNRKK